MDYQQVYRWSSAQVASFYDDARITRIRKRSVAGASLALLILTIVWPRAYGWWLWGSIIAALLVDYLLRAPMRNRQTYEFLRGNWTQLLQQSSPGAVFDVGRTALDPNESVIYAYPSARHADHISQSGAMSSAVTDNGELIVTSRRLLFLGRRNTLSVAIEDILRYTPSWDARQITFEYPGRPAGESFSVESPLFALCMNRRGGFTNFTALPPAPLPLDDIPERLPVFEAST